MYGENEEVRSIMSDKSDNKANLTIIVRNAAPRREEHYPHTWIVYSSGRAISVDVAHDLASHPYVEDRFRCG
jgi:hypothetical protein